MTGGIASSVGVGYGIVLVGVCVGVITTGSWVAGGLGVGVEVSTGDLVGVGIVTVEVGIVTVGVASTGGDSGSCRNIRYRPTPNSVAKTNAVISEFVFMCYSLEKHP